MLKAIQVAHEENIGSVCWGGMTSFFQEWSVASSIAVRNNQEAIRGVARRRGVCVLLHESLFVPRRVMGPYLLKLRGD